MLRSFLLLIKDLKCALQNLNNLRKNISSILCDIYYLTNANVTLRASDYDKKLELKNNNFQQELIDENQFSCFLIDIVEDLNYNSFKYILMTIFSTNEVLNCIVLLNALKLQI